MDSFSYLFAAYTAVWVVLFAYVLRLQRREKSLWQELELLRQKLGLEAENRPS